MRDDWPLAVKWVFKDARGLCVYEELGHAGKVVGPRRSNIQPLKLARNQQLASFNFRFHRIGEHDYPTVLQIPSGSNRLNNFKRIYQQ